MYRQSSPNTTAVIDPPYPNILFKEGYQGSEIARMQTYLNTISETYYPSIGKLTVDGVFGLKTKEAIMEYQALSGLKMDGIIGRNTWDNIVYVYNSIASGSQATWPGITLHAGSRSTDVKYMQQNLNELCNTYTPINTQNVDSVYGANMTEAVRLFQKQFGLTADGKLGHRTWDSINSVMQSVRSGSPAGVSTPYPGSPAHTGTRGDSVRFIQGYLDTLRNKLGYTWPDLRIDGVFGQSTHDAVVTFQSICSMKSDGIVGPETWGRIIYEYNGVVENSQS
jgi:peptidoglycan hydrolase-like protein with peptidoglycan-binding domain